MRRPERGECDDYYFLYIDEVPDGDVFELLERELARTLGLLESLGEARGDFAYAPGKWTVKEVVTHLVDCERAMAFRALSFARQDPAPLPSFDQDPWVTNAHAETRRLSDLAHELGALRASHVAMFRGFSDADWERTGIATGKRFTVRTFPWILVGHEMHHRKVLAERYAAR